MVGIFFVVNKQLLLHSCNLSEAEKYGYFLNYPKSHMEIWNKYYHQKYHVDFDYYPRGRIIYNTKEKIYYIYYDKCLENDIKNLDIIPTDHDVKLLKDFHYQCHKCNKNYVM